MIFLFFLFLFLSFVSFFLLSFSFFCSILSICPIRFNDMNRRVALLVHLLLPNEQEVLCSVNDLYLEVYVQLNLLSLKPVIG